MADLEATSRAGAMTTPRPLDVAAAFREHAPFLARMVARLLGPGAPAEDIVQQCFLVAHQRRHSLHGGPGLRAWLYRTCTHLVAHERRSFARRNRLRDAAAHAPVTPPAGADERADARERQRRLHDALARLPLQLREVFVLYEMEELTAPEIAALLGVAQGTVWRRAHMARAKFERAWLEEQP